MVEGNVLYTCNQGTEQDALVNDLPRIFNTNSTYEFGAMTPTRSPGSIPALSKAYARF